MVGSTIVQYTGVEEVCDFHVAPAKDLFHPIVLWLHVSMHNMETRVSSSKENSRVDYSLKMKDPALHWWAYPGENTIWAHQKRYVQVLKAPKPQILRKNEESLEVSCS